ncbi:MAG TPA: OadG family transporter subunit [Bacteroidales bacterium]
MRICKRSIRLVVFCFALSFLFYSESVYSQSAADLRINEILVINDSNYVDDYGQRSGWIEIFNSAYNTVNIAGMYLTNDPSNPTKYLIPTGDPLTRIEPRNYLVFFADNHPTRGILHLNFSLQDTNYLALFDVNGHTLIDEITYGQMNPDISFGRITDGNVEWGVLKKTTPNANNSTDPVISPGEKFVKMDPSGIGMAVVAMSVVFTALILLYVVFKNTRRLYNLNLKKVFQIRKPGEEKAETKEDISGEVNAAIAMALYLYKNELHDYEETVLTIKKVARTYSPWSSKIYGLRNFPR